MLCPSDKFVSLIFHLLHMLKKFPPSQPILEKKNLKHFEHSRTIFLPLHLQCCFSQSNSKMSSQHYPGETGCLKEFFVWIVAIIQLKPTYKDVEFSRSA